MLQEKFNYCNILSSGYMWNKTETKHWNNFETFSDCFRSVLGLFLFYFTCNHTWNKTETKLFRFSFISDVTTALSSNIHFTITQLAAEVIDGFNAEWLYLWNHAWHVTRIRRQQYGVGLFGEIGKGSNILFSNGHGHCIQPMLSTCHKVIQEHILKFTMRRDRQKPHFFSYDSNRNWWPVSARVHRSLAPARIPHFFQIWLRAKFPWSRILLPDVKNAHK